MLMRSRGFSVSADQGGVRLDLFLVKQLQSESRAEIQKLVQEGSVLLNGQKTKPSHKIHAGDRIELRMQEKREESKGLEAWAFPLEIIYEDEEILAIDKPPHVITHPGAGNQQHTIANAVIFARPEMKIVGHALRPGIVHRLDQETSGLLLLAKTEHSHQLLSAMFKDRKIEKHYRVLAYGMFRQQQGKIDKALGRDSRDRKKISVRAKRSRTAVTLYRVLQQFDFAALLDVQILTGRTHQVRVHLSSENHPIVGDTKYGGGNWNRIPDAQMRTVLKQAGFFGLHSFSLEFAHPSRGTQMRLECPLPRIWREIRTEDGRRRTGDWGLGTEW